MKKIISLALLVCMLISTAPVLASENEAGISDLITYEQPKNWDDYVIDSDPMQSSDKEFFGVWDSELEKWTVKRPFGGEIK